MTFESGRMAQQKYPDKILKEKTNVNESSSKKENASG